MKNLKNLHSLSSQLDDWFSELLRKSRIESFDLPCNTSNHNLFVKRDDLIHLEISGNKLRKLKWNIIQALSQNCDGILTFGGAFSNHLLATAAAGKELGISTIGIVRGEELALHSNHVLMRCAELGMELKFYTRTAFAKEKKRSGKESFEGRSVWVIPEGGANHEGVRGCMELLEELPRTFDFYILAQGTSTTSLGVLLTIPTTSKLIVVPVLKGFDVRREMRSILNDDAQFEIISKQLIIWDEAHHGGYAKTTESLLAFIDDFHQANTFRIEPVYTGKVLFELNQRSQAYFGMDQKSILFVHTGGVIG